MDDEDVRLYLHTQLTTVFPSLNVYYRPPGNVILQRPCIIYEPIKSEPSYANNSAYVIGTQFKVMLLSDLPGISARPIFNMVGGVIVESSRNYVTEDIVHDVFTVSVNSI